MKHLLLAFLTFTLFSCSKTEKKEQPFDSFVYTFSTLGLDYSAKFTNSDTVYFLKRIPKPETVTYAIMKETQKDSIIALIKKIDYIKYKSDYLQESLVDGSAFRFESIKDDKAKSINVYGNNAPKELYSYAKALNEVIKQLNFSHYDGKVYFGELIRPQVPVLPAPKS